MNDLFLTATRLLPLLDLTSLNDARDDDVMKLCRDAMTPAGPVAAVCVWPEHVVQAKLNLKGKPVKVATVANFPDGGDDADLAATEARAVLHDGADEVDMVMPHAAWLAGRREEAQKVIAAVKAVTGGRALLKVILETGALGDRKAVVAASRDAIGAGADFLKTSTGKRYGGASLEAADAMLEAIKGSGGRVGFKAAGGIREMSQAADYLQLVEDRMGRDWIGPDRFRIGASRLLDELLEDLQHMEFHTGEDDS